MMTDTNESDSSIIGKVGRVTARISTTRMGEIRIGIRGGTEDYLAIPADSADVFEQNTMAIIVNVLLPRTVLVRKVSHF